MEMKLELVPLPVSDVDRAKAFYTEKVGFNTDHDRKLGENVRFVQLTPPGSACSIAFGQGVTKMQPGSIDGLLMVVDDIQKTYKELKERGVPIREPAMMPWGTVHADFEDPDGNRWTLQQPARRSS